MATKKENIVKVANDFDYSFYNELNFKTDVDSQECLTDPVWPGLCTNTFVTHVPCHVLCVIVTCNMSSVKVDKVMELVDGGSVINGAYPI